MNSTLESVVPLAMFTFYCICWGLDLYRSIVATCFQTTEDQFPATTPRSRQFRKSTLLQVDRLPTTHQVRPELAWVLISSSLKTSLQVRTNRRAGSYIWESEGSAIYFIVYLVDSNDTVVRAKVISWYKKKQTIVAFSCSLCPQWVPLI